MPKLRRTRFALPLVAVVGSVAWLLIHLMHSDPPLPDLNQKLQRVLSDLVQKDRSVKNCVLSVATGDASFIWSGAAGIAHEDGRVPMASNTPIYIASVTKLFTATAVMLLVEKGLLSLDDPMAKYLPDEMIHGIQVYNGKNYSDEVTIQALLSHSSGIADYYSDKARDGKSLFELFVESPDHPWTVDETIARARSNLKAKFRPGTDTSYSDTNFQLLGKVIETVSSKPLHKVFEDFFFGPLGLEHTWLVGYRRSQSVQAASPADVFYGNMNITRIRANGAYWADGGIVSTAEEMNVFLRALNQGRIIHPASLKLMHNWRRWQFPLQYGFGTMYFKLPWPISAILPIPPLWGHSGSTGSFLYYSEDCDLYMAGTIDQTESKTEPFVIIQKVIAAIEVARARSRDRNR